MLAAGLIAAAAPALAGETFFSRHTPVVQAVQKVSAAVVNISSEYEVQNRVNPFFHFPADPFFREFFDHRGGRGYESRRKLTSLGSGVIIDGRRGLILTNEHVVVKIGTITVILNEGREFQADLVGADPRTDLAVLRIDAQETLPAIAMGNSDDLMIGETVIAIGNPFGFSNTVTTGVVSAVNRSVRAENKELYDLIQTDASINPGNSGGPLLNINGELIGINTAIYAKAEGINFAIPVSRARKIVNDLIAYGEVKHAWIGVTLQNIDRHLALYLNLPDNGGVVVRHVMPDSPAAAAGVREGDILTAMDARPVSTVTDFEMKMRTVTAGETLSLTLVRDGNDIQTAVKALDFPENQAMALAWRLLGVKVGDISPKDRRLYNVRAPSGVIIRELDKHAALADINARPGDVIRKIDEIAVNNVADFTKAIIKYRWKESIVILLQRGDNGYYITLQF